MTTQAEREMILEELKRSPVPNYPKIAKRYGLPASVVRDLDIQEAHHWKQSEDGLGRPSLRQYIVCVKHVDDPWPEDPAIDQAQELYDQGLVEMCQGRDGYNIILYSIPRGTQDKNREPYFSAEPWE